MLRLVYPPDEEGDAGYRAIKKLPTTTIRGLLLALADELDKIHGVEPVVAQPLTFSEGGVDRAIVADLNAWENDRRRQNKRGIRADRLRLDDVVAGCGWRSVSDMTPDSFLTWLGEKREAGWKGATANKTQCLLSTFLADVERRVPGRCPVNWAKGLPRASTDDSGDGSRPLTWPEFEQLQVWCQRHARKRGEVYMVVGFTGIRYTECRRLAVDEVRLDANPRLILTRRTKSKKKRTIPLHADIVPIMRKLIGKRKDGQVFHEFPTVRTLQYDCERAGIDHVDVGYHSLRKAFAGRCAMTGVPLAVAQKLLGHSDPKLTANIYTQFADGDLAQEVARLGYSEKSAKDSSRKVDEAHALGDTGSAETFPHMRTPTTTSRSSVPGRAGRMVTSQQRAHDAAYRPGTDVRDADPSSDVKATCGNRTHDLCFTNEHAGQNPSQREALADIFEGMARYLRGGAA